MRLEPGTRIAEITLEHKLGSGGQGEVWSGRRDDGELIAIKVLDSADPHAVLRAMREARLQGTVDHPHIVKMLDFQLVEGIPVILSELVDGLSLRQLLGKGRPTLNQIDHLAHQLFDAVEAAHEHGLVHRDLKPGNVLLTWVDDGYLAKITDFGIAVEAAPLGADDMLAERGFAMGTAGHMAPEQFLGNDVVDERADVFGLGTVLYWMVTGKRPFSGGSRMEVLRRAMDGAFTPVALVAPEVRETWAQAIHWALDPTARRRPQNMAAFRGAWDGDIALPDWVNLDPPVPTDTHRADDITEVNALLPDQTDASLAVSFGRQREISRARDALGEHRVVTLRGAPGIGKTHLAIQVAASLAASGRGWIQCYLAEARTLETLLVAISAGLAVPVQGADPALRVARAIAGHGPTTVVLDNAEQVAGPLSELLPRLLEQAPDARFLISSRRALGVPGESVIEVGPLDVHAGRALFLDRARRRRPNLRFAEIEPGTVQELVQRLEGNPLAIELAAARAVQTSGEALLQELRSGARNQERAMQVALRWSWRLLEPWDQYALGRCAVFRGGLTMEAAEALIDLSPWPEAPDAMHVVHGLVAHSLIQVRFLGQTRSRLHPYEAVRTFVLNEMPTSERAEAERAHAVWFARLGSDEGVLHRRGPAGAEAIRALLRDIENVATALDTSIRLGEGAIAADCATAIGEALGRLGPPAAGLDRVRAAIAISHDSKRDLARLQVVRGHLLKDSNQSAEARKAFEMARVLGGLAGDTELQAGALTWLGMLIHHGGDPTGAVLRFEQALDLLQDTGTPWRRSLVLRQLCAVNQHLGKLDEAEANILEALKLAEDNGVVIDIPLCHIHLGSLLAHQGKADEATAYEMLALQASRRMGDRVQEGRVLANLGVRLHQLGKLDKAIASFERGAEIARRAGSVGHEAIALGNMGESLMEAQKTERAEEALVRAIELGDQSWPVVAGTFRTTLARLRIRQKRFEDASSLLEVAVPALDGRHRTSHVAALLAQAEVAGHTGEQADGRALLKKAEAIYGPGMAKDRELAERLLAAVAVIEGWPG
ncbi:MAG: protein kinase [Proteobacteria bacterium]|nr:protein kinase [Pseudomonadota bacterium]